MYATPPPVDRVPATDRTGRAALGGVATALLLLTVLPRIVMAIPGLSHLMLVVDIGFAIGSASLWLVRGRKSLPGAFGFGATLVIAGFILLAALVFGFFVAAFHR